MQASGIAHGRKYTDFRLRLFVIQTLASRCFGLQPFATVRRYGLRSFKLKDKICDTPMRPNGVGRRADLMKCDYECAACEAKKTVIEMDHTTTSYALLDKGKCRSQITRACVLWSLRSF